MQLHLLNFLKNKSMEEYSWHKIAESEREILFNTNNIAMIQVNGKTMSLGRYRGYFFAFAYKCPHAGGILSDGWIDPKGNVVCPVHGYRFNMQNGRNVTGEGYNLKLWPVENRQDGMYVGIGEGLLSWL